MVRKWYAAQLQHTKTTSVTRIATNVLEVSSAKRWLKFQKLFETKDRINPYDHARVYVVDNFIHANGKVVEEEEFLEEKEKLLDMIGRFQCHLVIPIQICTTETHQTWYYYDG